MSDIPYKAYMDKTVICHTLAMSSVIIVLCLCMVTTCTCICTGVSKNSRFSTVYVYKEPSFVWPNPFLAQGVYHLQYKHPAKTLSIVVMLCSYLYVLIYLSGPAHSCMQHILCSARYINSASYYFHLKLWTEQLQLQLATCCSYSPIDLNLNARTTYNTHSSQLWLQHQQLQLQ